MGRNLHVPLILMCDKKNKEKGKTKPGEHFHFCLFFLVGKINVVLKQQRIFDPENFWKLLEEIVCFPPFFYCLKKKRLMGRLKNKENSKTSPDFLFPFLLFLRQPISLFFLQK